MIVQSTGADGRACAITLAAHQALAAQLAARFGNAAFAPLTPRAQMLFVVAHHDSGWHAIDSAPPGDPATSLPCSLGRHPSPSLLAAARRSIAVSEAHHPYCALMVSMHQSGLYNGRHGLLPTPPDPTRAPLEHEQVQVFLREETARQQRLLRQLRRDPAWRACAEDAAVFANYLRLQFVDRLALYLNLAGSAAPRPAVLERVPAAAGAECAITITPTAAGLALDPYPFCDDLVVSYPGHLLTPEPGVADWSARLAAAPRQDHHFHLMRTTP